MKIRFDRALSLIVGLIVGAIALVWPLLFVSNEFQEAESAPQLASHGLFGKTGAVVAALALACILGFVSFRLIRFGLRGPKPR
jgi:hypothetical protein